MTWLPWILFELLERQLVHKKGSIRQQRTNKYRYFLNVTTPWNNPPPPLAKCQTAIDKMFLFSSRKKSFTSSFQSSQNSVVHVPFYLSGDTTLPCFWVNCCAVTNSAKIWLHLRAPATLISGQSLETAVNSNNIISLIIPQQYHVFKAAILAPYKMSKIVNSTCIVQKYFEPEVCNLQEK